MRVGVGRLCRAVAASILLAMAIATALAAQSPQRPTFRGAAVLVNVDAYPTRDGQLVRGLTPDDFEVLEDGRPQKVENFEFVQIDSNPADGERRDPNTQEEGEALAADPHHRVFVVYFDIYHLSVEGARNLRQPVREFLERVIGPKDYVAALTPDITVHDMVFGQRLETIEEAVDKYWRKIFMMSSTTGGLSEPQSDEEQFLQDCFIGRGSGADALVGALIARHRLDAVLTGLREVTARLAAIRDERANILLFSGGWTLPGPNNQLSQRAWASQPTPRGGLPGLRTGPGMAPRTSAQCDAELQRLAAIDFNQSFLDILDTAKRANVSISTIDPAGLSIYDINLADQSPRNRNPQAKLDPLRVLASNTNGTAIVSTNDLKTPLRRIADEVSSYYLLGYYSTNTKFDGKYRKIEVKAKGPGVKILARRGYVALTDAAFNGRAGGPGNTPVAAPAGPSPVDDALAVLTRLRSPDSLHVDAAASPAEIAIVAELAAEQMGEWPKGADVSVTLTRPDGVSMSTVNARIDPGARSTLVRIPVDPGPGAWRAKVTLASEALTTSGSTEIRASDGALLGDPLVFRATPAARSPLSPVANRVFRRSERVHVEWAVTGALDQRIGRVLDRRGQPLPLTAALTDRDVSGRTVLAADVLLAPLAPGDYLVEVVAGRGAETVRRLVAFRIES
jgi:VWFA-related protein